MWGPMKSERGPARKGRRVACTDDRFPASRLQTPRAPLPGCRTRTYARRIQTAIYGYDASFEIVKYSLDGSAAEPIAARKKPTAGGGQLNMAADDDAIYWAEVGAGTIELKWRKK